MAITTIPGTNGSDTSIIGTAAADTINPKDFESLYVDGREGTDSITFSDATIGVITKGGDDNDSITYAAVAGGSVNGNKGNDNITIAGDVDAKAAFYGGQGNDTMTFSGLVEDVTEISGSIGTDTITFAKNVSTTKVLGNQDDDNITFSDLATAVSIYGGKSTDTITVQETSGSIVSGDKGGDIIATTSNSLNSQFLGGDGDDSITIGANDDTGSGSTIDGGIGRDTITINGDSTFVIEGGDDDDTINADNSSGAQTINGGGGNDDIDAVKAAIDQTIDAGDGDDNVLTNTGKDTIFGGLGKDVIDADNGANSVSGGEGADNITTGTGADTILGGTGADTINSGSGNDEIYAGKDEDLILVTAFTDLDANDTISGDNGIDTLEFQAAPEDVADVVFTGISSVENVLFDGTLAADEVMDLGAKAGAAGVVNVSIADAEGAFKITVQGGNNPNNVTYTGSTTAVTDFVAVGGSGNDVFNSGSAANDFSFTGAGGTNTFNVIGVGASQVITDLKGSDVLTVSAGNHAVAAAVTADFKATSSTTNKATNNNDVKLTANAGIDIDVSAASNTTGFWLVGNTGAETITGSAQADTIDGAAGKDTIAGGNGNDGINGGAGVDSMAGGGGADDFILDDVVSGAATIDVDIITDFTASQTDQLGDFSIADLKGLTVVTRVVSIDDSSVIIATDAIKTTTVTAQVDLDTISTNSITLSSTTAFTEATLATALSTGGSHELTIDQNRSAADGTVVFYDNNVDSFAAVITNAIAINDGAAGAFVVNNLTHIKGVSDATTIADANLLTIVA